jgi:hypothetical protein
VANALALPGDEHGCSSQQRAGGYFRQIGRLITTLDIEVERALSMLVLE